MALLMKQEEPQHTYEYICTPTGNELPEMAEHMDRLEGLLGQPILRLGIGKNLYELIHDQKMIPNHRARWCTRMLKIEPAIEYMEALPKSAVMCVGLRADEPDRRGLYGEDIKVRFPLREYNFDILKVRRFLQIHQVKVPIRTDCGVCYHQRLGEWWHLWRDYPDIYQEGVDLEQTYGHTFRSKERDSWPASLEMLRAKFEQGHIPTGSRLTRDLFDDDNAICRVCSL